MISIPPFAVLGTTPRAFKDVLERAQGTLRTTFGMELVELQSRAELDKEDASNDNADGDRRKATGVKKKGKHVPSLHPPIVINQYNYVAATSGSKSYILRSILDPTILDYAALTDQELYEREIEDLPEGADDAALVAYGSIISWSDSDQLGSLGVLYVVLALILVSGRVIADSMHIPRIPQLRLMELPQMNCEPSSNNYSYNQQILCISIINLPTNLLRSMRISVNWQDTVTLTTLRSGMPSQAGSGAGFQTPVRPGERRLLMESGDGGLVRTARWENKALLSSWQSSWRNGRLIRRLGRRPSKNFWRRC